MKKILFVQHNSAIGGSSGCLLEILRGLNRNEVDPQVLLFHDGPLADAVRADGIPVAVDPHLSAIDPIQPFRGSLFHSLEFVRDLLRTPRCLYSFFLYCRKLKPDVVYLNSSALFTLAAPAKRAGVATVILHNREHWHHQGVFWFKTFLKNRIVRQSVDRIFSITECGIKQFGFCEKSIVVRDWPAFEEEPVRNVRSGLGLCEDTFMILVPGGLNRIKGTLDVLQALQYIQQPNRVAVVVLGCENYPLAGWKAVLLKLVKKERYLERVKQLAGFYKQVFLLPPTRQMKGYLEQCDVVLCPFSIPHAARPALEAAQAGRPSVLYDGEEAREYVQNKKTGWLVSPGDIKGLAAAIDDLMRHPEVAAQMGAVGRDYAQRVFSQEKSMRLIHAALNESKL